MAHKAIALIRVSTLSQDLEQQKEKVYEEMRKDGYKASQIISIATKESGVKLSAEERLGLIEMKETIEKEDIAAVYCYELSRLSRRSADLYKIRDYLLENKVQLIVLNPYFKCFNEEDWTPSTTSNIMFSIFTAMAENEGFLRKERTMRGINKARSEGKWTGGQKLYGYDVNKDNRYIINEEEAEIVRLVFRMYTDENKGTYQIAKIIQAEYGGFRGNKSFESSQTRIRSMLANELYTGQTDYTPQIISPEYFEKTKKKREANKTGVRKKTKHISFCSGILFSKIDGTHFHASVKQHCYINRESGRNLHISYNHIDSLAWHLASAERGGKMSFNAPKESEKLKKELESLKKQLNVINSEIEDISKKYDRVESRFINGKISEDMADELEKKLDKEKEGKEVEKKTIQDKIKSTTLLIKKSATYISGDFATAIKNLNSLDDKSKYEIIHEEIKAIYVEKDEDRKHKFICKVEVEFIEGYTRTFFLNTFNKKIMELWGDGTLHEFPVVIYDRSDYKTAQRGKTFKNRITIEKLK